MTPGIVSRREWLALSAAALAGGRAAFARQRDRRWGVQLYTVRELLAKDAAATLGRIAAIGYKELEILQPTLDVVAPIASKLGLSIVSAHLDGATAAGNGLTAFLDKASAHGLRYVVVPYIAPADRPKDRGGFQQLGGRLARMSDDTRKAGLELAYHNHAFEFGAEGGERWLDVLMATTAAARMKLQLDVFWASIAGADPVAVIKQYSGRIASLHLKDKKRDAPTVLSEAAVARDTFVEVGSGALDFPDILGAARAAGVAHYFVEQDATPGDAVESLKTSFAYLAKLPRAD